MNQAELARLVGVTRKTLQRWEKAGKLPPKAEWDGNVVLKAKELAAFGHAQRRPKPRPVDLDDVVIQLDAVTSLLQAIHDLLQRRLS